MPINKKYINVDGSVNYDHMNEDYMLEEARKAREVALTTGSVWAKARQDFYTKEALKLRAKQDRKKTPKSALEAVDKGIKDADLDSMFKARRRRMDKAIDG
jgi:hypothetical protein